MSLREDVFGEGADDRFNERQRRWDTYEEHTRKGSFYHGSNADLTGQKFLKPSSQTGRENFDYEFLPNPEQRRSSVFMTTPHPEHPDPEEHAWGWASSGGGDLRRTVYEVQPVGKVTPDTVKGAVMAPKAKILRSIDIPPPAGTRGGDVNAKYLGNNAVQGTLPPVNWNQFHPVEGGPQNQNYYDRMMAIQGEESRQNTAARLAHMEATKPFNPGRNQIPLFNDKRFMSSPNLDMSRPTL